MCMCPPEILIKLTRYDLCDTHCTSALEQVFLSAVAAVVSTGRQTTCSIEMVAKTSYIQSHPIELRNFRKYPIGRHR